MKMRNREWLIAIRSLLIAVILVSPASSQSSMKVLYYFHGGNDGGYPTGGLVRDDSGNVYGTAFAGGTSGAGVVFAIDSTGNESALYTFAGGADGSGPSGGLVRDNWGNLYGTTFYGGSSDLGTVFKIDSSGNHSVLHSFTGGADGANPYATVTRDPFDNLYGTTYAGGTYGVGTVFEVDFQGDEKVLHSFSGGIDGAKPFSGVIVDRKGNLFGTSSSAGRYGYGTVFRVNTFGVETTLHSFNCCYPDGAEPEGGLAIDGSGNLYGTTYSGGVSGGGVVFVVRDGGQEAILYNFPPSGINGANPVGGVVHSNGNLYGTTLIGGPGFSGTVFKVDPNNNFSVLHDFKGTDGARPESTLTVDDQGNLYGAAHSGGTFGYGSVFELTYP
jgi:uncharacterized repeat protein (TIGR03803 family)